MQPATHYWRERAHTYGPGWLDLYWESWTAPHRIALADALPSCGDFSSLLELGCHCGPNLRLWAERWPQVALYGLDVNREAIAFGQAHLGHHASLWAADLNWPLTMDIWLPPVDVVVSCYALCYVRPVALMAVLERAWAVARLGVVVAEPMPVNGEPVGPCAQIEEWRHDYAEAFRSLGATVEVRAIPPVDRLNGICIARRPE